MADDRVRLGASSLDRAPARCVVAYSARFPLILMVVFGAIALWFRRHGGYKPVELGQGHG